MPSSKQFFLTEQDVWAPPFRRRTFRRELFRRRTVRRDNINFIRKLYPASWSTFSSLECRFLFNIFFSFIPLLIQHFHQFYPASCSTLSSVLSRFMVNIIISFIPLHGQHYHQFHPASCL